MIEPGEHVTGTVEIQPLVFRRGPHFGRQVLSVFARSLNRGELPRRLSIANMVWHLTASIDPRDSLIRVDPLRQMGNLVVVGSAEGVRTASDAWVEGATQPLVREGGSIVECTILDITEEQSSPDSYADFVRRYEIDRTPYYPQSPMEQ